MSMNLQFLGIYEGAIDYAIEAAKEAVKRAGVDISELDDCAMQELEESGNFSDITNSIIGAYFIVAYDLIRQKMPKWDVKYYVNCHDSHFYINGEEV